jgi:hypothetical protein
VAHDHHCTGAWSLADWRTTVPFFPSRCRYQARSGARSGGGKETARINAPYRPEARQLRTRLIYEVAFE